MSLSQLGAGLPGKGIDPSFGGAYPQVAKRTLTSEASDLLEHMVFFGGEEACSKSSTNIWDALDDSDDHEPPPKLDPGHGAQKKNTKRVRTEGEAILPFFSAGSRNLSFNSSLRNYMDLRYL